MNICDSNIRGTELHEEPVRNVQNLEFSQTSNGSHQPEDEEFFQLVSESILPRSVLPAPWTVMMSSSLLLKLKSAYKSFQS